MQPCSGELIELLVLSSFIWICFICLFHLGELKRRVDNDDKHTCTICGERPQGIYQISREELASNARGLLGDGNSDLRKNTDSFVGAVTMKQPALHQFGCTLAVHVCTLSADLGCASCRRTCHTNCDSPLCEFSPCCICASFSLVTHENSTLCIEAQTDNVGCHACGRFHCSSLALHCHANCIRNKHVCGSDDNRGCSSCGHLCHDSNSDVRCPYFQRSRHALDWETNEQQSRDTQPGTGGAVPHFSQVVWRFNTTRRRSAIVEVDGVSYYVGHGDPGRATENESNNCLIDSLRQCIGIHVDRRRVRADLLQEFSAAIGRARVTQGSFLDFESHWRAILQSISRHNT